MNNGFSEIKDLPPQTSVEIIANIKPLQKNSLTIIKPYVTSDETIGYPNYLTTFMDLGRIGYVVACLIPLYFLWRRY